MPSPLGHALAGAAIALVAEARQPQPRQARFDNVLLIAGIGLAMAPDLDFIYRPVHRIMTHSITAVVLVGLIAWLVGRRTRPDRSLRIAMVCGLAYGSHLLLDWMGNDTNLPAGIQAGWPFDRTWYISQWGVFAATHVGRRFWQAGTMAANALAMLREVAILGPIALAAWALARRRPSRPLP
jgi:membrane-bound metal-dependent hydrolase YbcI (DUF457 family)